MSFDAFRLFAIGSKQTRNATTPEARRLRLEALEDRALLSVSDVPVFCGPPTYEAWQAQQNLLAETQTTSISSAVVSASANNSDDATLYLVSDVEDSQTDSAPLQDVYSQYLNEGFVNGDDLDEFIEVVGVTFLNGDSDNDDSDSDDSDDEGGTRDVIDWPISLSPAHCTARRIQAYRASKTYYAKVTALLERNSILFPSQAIISQYLFQCCPSTTWG